MSALPEVLGGPFKAVCSSHDRPTWLLARLCGIGASEIAGVLSESPWASPLSVYQDKAEPAEDEDQERLFWGRELEPSIIRGYATRTGREARPHGLLLQSTEHPWAICTLDGETRSGPGVEWNPLEAKNVHFMAVDQWEDGAPRHVYLQAQHQMLVTGADRVTVVALLGGSQLVWEDVDRDETEIRRIIAMGSAFWADHVLARVPPGVDGHDATKRALLNLYPNDEGSSVDVGAEYLSLDSERVGLKASIKADGERLKVIDNELKATIGNATACALPDGTRYSWKAEMVREHIVKTYTKRVLRRHAPKD